MPPITSSACRCSSRRLILREDGKPFRRLMIAQDVGSAIRGPERGDIFFGTGEAAGAIAGGAAHPARFFILLPKR